MKAFLQVSLVSLTLRKRTVFKIYCRNASNFAAFLKSNYEMKD